jgi:hypothetical protein
MVKGAVSALANLGGEQFDRIAGDLARRLVSALPVPALAPSRSVAGAGNAGDFDAPFRTAAPQPLTMRAGGGLI